MPGVDAADEGFAGDAVEDVEASDVGIAGFEVAPAEAFVEVEGESPEGGDEEFLEADLGVEGMDTVEGVAVEADDRNPAVSVAGLDHGDDAPFEAGVVGFAPLNFYPKSTLAIDQIKGLLQGGDGLSCIFWAEPSAVVELLEVCVGVVVDAACAVGAAVEGLVVVEDHDGVEGLVDVDLKVLGTGQESASEGGEGVFGGGVATASVGDNGAGCVLCDGG